MASDIQTQLKSEKMGIGNIKSALKINFKEILQGQQIVLIYLIDLHVIYVSLEDIA